MSKDELTAEEKMTAYQIARNFQDKPKVVKDKLIAEFGRERLDEVIEWLREVTR